MRVPFIKMHGLGNDFIVLDGRAAPLPAMTERLAAALADRKTGIGCDQLVVLEPSSLADVRMRIFNADGGEVEACGNATRAVGLLLGKPASIETLGGMLATTPLDAGIAVDMGEPRFDWAAIPLAYALDTLTMPPMSSDTSRVTLNPLSLKCSASAMPSRPDFIEASMLSMSRWRRSGG